MAATTCNDEIRFFHCLYDIGYNFICSNMTVGFVYYTKFFYIKMWSVQPPLSWSNASQGFYTVILDNVEENMGIDDAPVEEEKAENAE